MIRFRKIEDKHYCSLFDVSGELQIPFDELFLIMTKELKMESNLDFFPATITFKGVTIDDWTLSKSALTVLLFHLKSKGHTLSSHIYYDL